MVTLGKTAPEAGTLQLDAATKIDYVVTRSARRRRTVAFVMDGPTRIRVMAPQRTSTAWIESLLQRQAGYIRTRLASFARAATNFPVYVDGGLAPYMGRMLKISVLNNVTEPQGCRLRPHHLRINIQEEHATTHMIRLEVLLWAKARAKQKLAKRATWWASRMALNPRHVQMTNAKGLWGSCAADNVIRLNWRLILAPLSLMDYVVVHELAHIVHKNHSARFWDLVGHYIPDYRERRAKLRAMTPWLGSAL